MKLPAIMDGQDPTDQKWTDRLAKAPVKTAGCGEIERRLLGADQGGI